MNRNQWPHYSQEEIAAVSVVLDSGRVNYWTGSECKEFENEFATYHGVPNGIALSNGTVALELALAAFGIGDGDEVIVTPRSFFASASCVVRVGATPIFVDVDRDSQNITASTIESKITMRTRAILPVHLAGWPCEMSPIIDLAKSRNLRVIEDCAQAHGARIGEKPVGSFGDASAFSFCQDKIMSTAGEGGMLLTSDSEVWKKVWELKDHGKSWNQVMASDHPPGFRWLHGGIGSNFRLTEVQGAIGRIQLKKLNGWVKTRRRNADRLWDGLHDLPLLRIPRPTNDVYHSYYKSYVFINSERLKVGWTRDRILAAFEADGIPGLSGSCPEIYLEKAFENERYDVLPVARELGETSIMFMVHPTLSDGDIDNTIEVARRVISLATR